MRTKAALLHSQPGKWEVTEVDLDEPRENEVLIRMAASGLCHSDDHFVTGDMMAGYLPMCGGHEGSGVVERIGSGVSHVQPGDHVVMSFLPACGRCRWCATGRQNLCDLGGLILSGAQLDGTYRMHADGQTVGQMAMISTFSEYTVAPAMSVIKIPRDIPLAEACLVGCGVPTGWGSAVKAAAVSPGDVTIVMGVGGVGINAVQGARHAGATRIIAVDPVEFKREKALEFGATDVVHNIQSAGNLARDLTNGQGADSCIVTVGVINGDMVSDAFSTIRKGGTLAVTGVGKMIEVGLPINLFELAMFEKRIQGVLYGSLSPATDMLRLLGMYQAGQLKLTELITRTYTLDQINEGYADLHAGRNLRGVITFS